MDRITWHDVCASRFLGSVTRDSNRQPKPGFWGCCRGIWATLQTLQWVVGKKRAEQRPGSEPLACRLTLLVVVRAFNEVSAVKG